MRYLLTFGVVALGIDPRNLTFLPLDLSKQGSIFNFVTVRHPDSLILSSGR